MKITAVHKEDNVIWQTIVELNIKFYINKNPTGLPVGMSILNTNWMMEKL